MVGEQWPGLTRACECEEFADGCHGGARCFWLYRASNLTAEAFAEKYPQLASAGGGRQRNGG